MTPLETLKSVLLELAGAVGEDVPLIVGGGFGLYLLQEQRRQSDERTLFAQLPEPRATNDIDLFLTMEVLVKAEQVKQLREQIEQFGFVPIQGAEYFQWKRADEQGRELKLDFLCGPLTGYADRLHTNSLPRVRPIAPAKTLSFHARLTEEALELDRKCVRMEIEGKLPDGTPRSEFVSLPHPFTYLLMKLLHLRTATTIPAKMMVAITQWICIALSHCSTSPNTLRCWNLSIQTTWTRN